MSSVFNEIKNRALNAALNIADTFTPVLKESKFRETGFITPEEFVIAGDFLTGHCPTWQWANITNPKACKDYLPPEKQFLITKNVPCTKRCRHLMESFKNTQEKVIEVESGEGGWVDTHFLDTNSGQGTNQAQEIVDDRDQNDREEEIKNIKDLEREEDEEDDDEEALDMDEYDHNVIDNDETTVITKPTKQEAKADAKPVQADQEEEIFIPTRTYDLNITYDNYYRTPRLWLSGYDENNKPLTIEQMYDDISEDHAKKTVTFETHPHIPGTLMASIHPCRHAEVMKKLMNLMAESGKELEVHSYLMVFLKFVQSVIPTIEYDYTRNITI
uniref:Ubiquitin-like-conjugating enzyme ATG3 n=1 Tax=Brachionus rotundiformis TaxID=96890 RepID=A0A2Z4EUI6_9BILA|nr:autophagy related protein 3 [Brachionus rotundiformis]